MTYAWNAIFCWRRTHRVTRAWERNARRTQRAAGLGEEFMRAHGRRRGPQLKADDASLSVEGRDALTTSRLEMGGVTPAASRPHDVAPCDVASLQRRVDAAYLRRRVLAAPTGSHFSCVDLVWLQAFTLDASCPCFLSSSFNWFHTGGVGHCVLVPVVGCLVLLCNGR